MIKKLIAFACALFVVAAAATVTASAGNDKSSTTKSDKDTKSEKDGTSDSSSSTKSTAGTITSWDDAAKTFIVTDAAGKLWTFAWHEQTKVSGTPKVGERVKIAYKQDKAGKAWATKIHADTKSTASAASPAKY